MADHKIIITTEKEVTNLFNKELTDFKAFLENYAERIRVPTVLPANEAAKYFRMSEATLRDHSGENTYGKYTFADRLVYYDVKEIEDYILSNVNK